jgi:hypothetical protein
LAPHAVLEGALQWPPWQQPLQLAPPHVHAPPLHACPTSQVPQAFPPVPQAAVDCAPASTQLFCASQHPLGHEAGEQVHVPAGPQACPPAQPWHAAPPAPQAAADWPA